MQALAAAESGSPSGVQQKPLSSHDIFLSYIWGAGQSRRPFARTVVAFLRTAGYSVWFDEDHLAAASQDAGLIGAIAHGLSACSAVVMLFSPDYAASPNCKTEVLLARDYRRPLFPVNVGAPGYSHMSYNASSPAEVQMHGLLHAVVGDALYADGTGGDSAWGAPGGGGATLLAALAGDARVRRTGAGAP